MKTAFRVALYLSLLISPAFSDGIINGGGSGGGGSGTVTSIATGCQATGGTITTSGTISTQTVITALAGTNPAITTGYCGGLENFNNASPQIPTIAVAGSAGFPQSWYTDLCNIGAGTQTITPATGTIGGAATYVLAAGTAAAPKCVRIISDAANTNYVLEFPPSSGATGSAGGDLTGTYPNPTVKASVGLTGTPTAPTASAGDSSTQIATDAFVTTAVANAIAGVNPAIAVKAATTAAGDTSAWTYANGASGIGATFTGPTNTAITIDGVTFTAVTQRLLVKNDTQSPSGAFNGIYTLTALQTGITGAIFTRALDYDAPSDINNTGSIPVVSGTANGSTSWLLTSSVTTVGTDPLTFTQFTINPTTVITTSTLATNAAKGIMQGDGTTVSCAAGVCTAQNTTLNGKTLTPGASATVTGWAINGYFSSNWYIPPVGIVAGSAQVASTVYCSPWVVGAQGLTFKTMGMIASTTAVGNASMAIYNSDGTGGRPGSLAIAIGTTGVSTNSSPVNHAPSDTTHALNAGAYWACETADNTSVVFNAVQSNAGSGIIPSLLGSATQTVAMGTANTTMQGLKCLAASACGGSFAAWSAGSFTWSSLSSATWTEVSNGANTVPVVALQAN